MSRAFVVFFAFLAIFTHQGCGGGEEEDVPDIPDVATTEAPPTEIVAVSEDKGTEEPVVEAAQTTTEEPVVEATTTATPATPAPTPAPTVMDAEVDTGYGYGYGMMI